MLADSDYYLLLLLLYLLLLLLFEYDYDVDYDDWWRTVVAHDAYELLDITKYICPPANGIKIS